MQIDLIPDASVATAPAGFAADVQQAAAILDQDFTDDITISIRYGWGTFDNEPDRGIPANGAEGGPLDQTTVTYAQLRTALIDKPTLPGDLSMLSSLPISPTAFPDGDSNFTIASAEEKALGLFTGAADTIDGAIGFGTYTPPSFWVEGALHEITHAMGRVTGSISNPTVFDLYRYSAPGQYEWTSGLPAYFSIDGGTTALANFDLTSDPSDWLQSSVPDDPFDAIEPTGNLTALTPLDITVMDALGFAPVGAEPAPPTADMILREPTTGDYEIYDFGYDELIGAHLLGQVGTNYVFAGLGDFFGADTSDMLLRDANTGNFEVYDISNSQLIGAAPLGNVGLEWQVAGFGGFNGSGASTEMMTRDTVTGTFEIYDIANNTVTAANAVGQVGLEWQVAGFGDFSSNPDETDMLLRDVNTGAFEAYDIANNAITSAGTLGQVGLAWQVAGFGDFSGNPNETDMMLRNANTGQFELYDIQNNQITSASAIGQVGLEWQVAGFGPLNGADSSDMVLRNTQSGVFEVYDIANNQLAGAASLGQVGLDWQVGGFAPDPLNILAR
jgi:hypothetical protein